MTNASTKAYANAYAYAQRNGYAGTYDDYVALQFQTYCDTCKRNEVEPLPLAEWRNLWSI